MPFQNALVTHKPLRPGIEFEFIDSIYYNDNCYTKHVSECYIL